MKAAANNMVFLTRKMNGEISSSSERTLLSFDDSVS